MTRSTPITTPLADFASTIVQWQQQHGRHHLPWQNTRDPYRIWLSEIMLQQTQVATVISYYERFLQRFPDIQTLAGAEQDDVMPYWAGLGYYARARNLHRCAQVLCESWDGRFPPKSVDIQTLPGIGRSTAAAIAAFAFDERSPIMDGNVKRLFTRYFGIEGNTASRAVEQRLWETAEQALAVAPHDLNMPAYTQGLMDLGAQTCTRSKPLCNTCPLNEGCYARQTGRQTELPTPKPRKRQPEHHCAMLILQSADAVLLHQRPSNGTWGGLLSLPQFDTAESLADACRNWGITVSPEQKMAGLSHTFSHFKLHIEPWLIQAETKLLMEPAQDHIWLPIEDLTQAALPAPVRKLLEGIYKQDLLRTAP